MRVILRGLERDVLEATEIVPSAQPISVERPPMKVAPPDTAPAEQKAGQLESAPRSTRVDFLLTKIKNNPVLAALIVLGTVLSGLAAFTNTIVEIPNAVGKIRSFVFGSAETEAERRLMIEVGHRASAALKRLEKDREEIGQGKLYPAADIYYNAVCHLNNAFPPEWGPAPNYSVFNEYRTWNFQSLIGSLMAVEDRAKQPQLKRAWDAFQQLDDLSNSKNETVSNAELSKQKSLEAVAKASEIIKNKVVDDYFKSSIE